MTESAPEFKCIHCELMFDTRGKRIHHVDRMHRLSLEIKLQDDSVKSFFKDHHGRWNCVCNRSYLDSSTFRRHVKSPCKSFLTEAEQVQEGNYSTSFKKPLIILTGPASTHHQRASQEEMEQHLANGNVIKYIPKYRILICIECGYTINSLSNGIARHLVSTHKWRKTEADALAMQFADVGPILQPSNSETQWIYLQPEDPPIPHLPVFTHGFGCHLCSHVSGTEKHMRNHYGKDHKNDPQFQSSPKQHWRKSVQIQRFAQGGPIYIIPGWHPASPF